MTDQPKVDSPEDRSVFPNDNPETVLLAERQGEDVDPLTKLRQRSSFERELSNKKPGTFSLLYIDMDNLKQANDLTKSHSVGDRALVTIADELKANIRDRNSDGDDEAFRYHGDEFVVILDKVADPEQLKNIAQRVLTTIGSHKISYKIGDERQDLELSVSVGASVSHVSDSNNNAEIVERSDKALYEAKAHGRNQVVVYDESVIIKP